MSFRITKLSLSVPSQVSYAKYAETAGAVDTSQQNDSISITHDVTETSRTIDRSVKHTYVSIYGVNSGNNVVFTLSGTYQVGDNVTFKNNSTDSLRLKVDSSLIENIGETLSTYTTTSGITVIGLNSTLVYTYLEINPDNFGFVCTSYMPQTEFNV